MIIVSSKEVSLTFRGFECSTEVIEELIGVQASEKGIRGGFVKPGVKALLKRSFVRFSVILDSGSRLDQVIPSLLDEMGGLSKLIRVRDSIRPEFFEIDILWPIKNSKEQDGGFFSSSTISDVANLKCSLSFSFV
jgi:hypothetical protein